MSEKLREEDVTRKAQIKDIAKFIKRVLQQPTVPKIEKRDRINTTSPHSVPVKRRVLEFLPSTSAETVYVGTPRKPKFEIEIDDDEEVEDDDDDDDNGVETDVRDV